MTLFELATANARDQFRQTTPAPVASAPGPQPCCATDAIVTHCDGEIDTYRCLTCGSIFRDRCPDADLVAWAK